MKTVFNKIKGFFVDSNSLPTPLPRGLEEFEAWASNIIQTYGLPDNDSLRFALATMIMHLPPTEDAKPIEFFGKSARKGASNQVAHQVMMDLKAKQAAAEAARIADEAAKSAEVTAPQVVTSDASQD